MATEIAVQTICPIIEEGAEDEAEEAGSVEKVITEEETDEPEPEEIPLEDCSSGSLFVKIAKDRANKERELERQTLEDEGSDTDLEMEEQKTDYDMSGRTTYLNACRTLGIVPVSYFLRHMNDQELSLAHHGLGSQGMKALSFPLMNNTKVLSLDLQDNWIEGEGGEYIAEMLKENCYVVYLNIAGNRIGKQGCNAICKVLQNNTTLKHINLSGNELSDTDGQCIADMLNENNILKTLSLSHNQFGHSASTVLSNAISENETIEKIDLSWNNFRLKSGYNICQGIATNSRLRVVNLAMNGLGNEGAFGVAEMVKQSGTITEIDVSNNRIGLPGASAIGKALEGNDLLKIFKIGYNPIGINGIKAIFAGVCPGGSNVKELDISGIEVDKEFRTMKEQLQETKDIVIRHGPVLSDYVIKPKPKKKQSMFSLFSIPIEEITTANIMTIIKAYYEEIGMDIYDTLLQYDKNKEKRVTWENFVSAVADTGVQFSLQETDQLENMLVDFKNAEGKIDFRYLYSTEHREIDKLIGLGAERLVNRLSVERL